MTKPLCKIPFTALTTDSDGTSVLCCHAVRHKFDKKLQTDSLEAIWNSTQMQDVRQTLLNGQWPSQCEKCETHEKNGIESGRQRFERLIPDTGNYQTVMPVSAITRIDTRFGNVCNLKCRMCSPAFSNQVYDEWHLYGDADPDVRYNMDPNYHQKINEWIDIDSTWENLDRLAATLTHIKVEGGEPSISPSVLRFMDMIIAKGRANEVTIQIATNLTNINANFKSRLEQFHDVIIEASLDGVGPVCEYIRYPANWQTLVRNMNTYLEMPNVEVFIFHTTQIYNIMGLPNMIKWFADNYGNNPKIFLHLAVLRSPEFLCIRNLPAELKLQILPKLEAELAIRPARWAISDVINMLLKKNPGDSLRWHEFVAITKKLDESRRQNFLSIAPEFDYYFK